jgi:hypothetical protein
MASLPPLPLQLLPGGANQFGRELHPLKIALRAKLALQALLRGTP